MSAFVDMLFRTFVHKEIKDVTVEEVARKRSIRLHAGEMEVRTATGNIATLPFSSMFKLHPEAVQRHFSPETLFEFIEELWPESVGKRRLHTVKDGLSLCDMTLALRGEWYALGLLQFGQLSGWWRVVYDEHIVCPHAGEGTCGAYCTIYIDEVKRPPKRPKRKRERKSLAVQIKLPALFPERGIAIAH